LGVLAQPARNATTANNNSATAGFPIALQNIPFSPPPTTFLRASVLIHPNRSFT
jgi:hypothetical protein